MLDAQFIFIAFVFLLAVAAGLTGLARWYAIKRAVVDIPNERSSHQKPTVRGGGISIVLVTLLATAGLAYQGTLPANIAWAIEGGWLVALIGWLDDHRHVSARWRALCHFIAAAWAVYWLGGVSEVAFGDWVLQLGWVGDFLAVLAIVWLLNLFNFMDGIDGIAGMEGAFVALVGGGLLWFSGNGGLAAVGFALAAGCLGFLVWNWPPAKIFMGDVGSGTIGFLLAVLALAGEKTAQLPALLWVIILALFVWDATFTLIMRVMAGERWYAAHRSHAYQRLTQLGWTHKAVTSFAFSANVLLILPLSWIAWSMPHLLQGIFVGIAMGCLGVWSAIQTSFKRRSLCGQSE